MIPRFWKRNGWRWWHAALVVALVGAAVGITFEAWQNILEIALRNEEQSHILLVPIVAAWLVWVRRGRARYCRPTGTLIGPLLIGIGWLISWYGFHHAVQSFWQGGALLVVVGAFLTVAGKDVLLRYLPAFVVLVFLVPVPGLIRQKIALPLQFALADMTQHVLELFGMAVRQSGNLLIINGQRVAIAEACNGMRMVFALVLVSYAFAFGTPLRGYVRFLILALSPLSALLCNFIRMIPTVWLYGKPGVAPWLGMSEMELANKFHDVAGWAMLVVAFLLLMGIIRLLRWALVPVTYYTLAYD